MWYVDAGREIEAEALEYFTSTFFGEGLCSDVYASGRHLWSRGIKLYVHCTYNGCTGKTNGVQNKRSYVGDENFFVNNV